VRQFLAAAEIFFLQSVPPAEMAVFGGSSHIFSAISAKRFGLNHQDAKFAKSFC
jgi:hypothetical protein